MDPAWFTKSHQMKRLATRINVLWFIRIYDVPWATYFLPASILISIINISEGKIVSTVLLPGSYFIINDECYD